MNLPRCGDPLSSLAWTSAVEAVGLHAAGFWPVSWSPSFPLCSVWLGLTLRKGPQGHLNSTVSWPLRPYDLPSSSGYWSVVLISECVFWRSAIRHVSCSDSSPLFQLFALPACHALIGCCLLLLLPWQWDCGTICYTSFSHSVKLLKCVRCGPWNASNGLVLTAASVVGLRMALAMTNHGLVLNVEKMTLMPPVLSPPKGTGPLNSCPHHVEKVECETILSAICLCSKCHVWNGVDAKP